MYSLFYLHTKFDFCYRVRNDLEKNFLVQKEEHKRLHYQVNNLRYESDVLSQKSLGLQRRIQEMEHHLGIEKTK